MYEITEGIAFKLYPQFILSHIGKLVPICVILPFSTINSVAESLR